MPESSLAQAVEVSGWPLRQPTWTPSGISCDATASPEQGLCQGIWAGPACKHNASSGTRQTAKRCAVAFLAL